MLLAVCVCDCMFLNVSRENRADQSKSHTVTKQLHFYTINLKVLHSSLWKMLIALIPGHQAKDSFHAGEQEAIQEASM